MKLDLDNVESLLEERDVMPVDPGADELGYMKRRPVGDDAASLAVRLADAELRLRALEIRTTELAKSLYLATRKV